MDFLTAEDEHGSIVDREVGETEMGLKWVSTDGNESVGDVGVENDSFMSLPRGKSDAKLAAADCTGFFGGVGVGKIPGLAAMVGVEIFSDVGVDSMHNPPWLACIVKLGLGLTVILQGKGDDGSNGGRGGAGEKFCRDD